MFALIFLKRTVLCHVFAARLINSIGTAESIFCRYCSANADGMGMETHLCGDRWDVMEVLLGWVRMELKLDGDG